MKFTRILPALFLTFLLLGCYEVNEELTIKADGSGVYATHMDMGQLFEMMKSMGGDDMSKEGLDKVIDTVMDLGSMTDTSTSMTPQQKELYSKGKMRLQMNAAENIFKIDMNIPFKSYNDLQLLLSGNGNPASISNAMKKIFGGAAGGNEPDSPKDPGLDEIGNIYESVVSDGLISKKINKTKYDALMSRPEMEQMKQVTGSGLEVLYTTSFTLPRPVIEVDNTLFKVSEDKKTLTMKYNFLEVFESPEKFSYTIKY